MNFLCLHRNLDAFFARRLQKNDKKRLRVHKILIVIRWFIIQLSDQNKRFDVNKYNNKINDVIGVE